MQRTRAYRREVRNKHITRKKLICRNVYGSAIGGVNEPGKWYKHDGQYSKGKIHCGCKLCKYGRHFNLPTTYDMREISKFKSELSEFYSK